MKLEERFYNLRKEKNKTQEELAELLSVSRQTISNWETGNAIPTIDKVIELAKVYNISLDELVGIQAKSSKISTLLHSLTGEICTIYLFEDDNELDHNSIVGRNVYKNATVIEVGLQTILIEYKEKKQNITKMIFLDQIVYIEKGEQ